MWLYRNTFQVKLTSGNCMVNKKKNRKDAHGPQRAVHSLWNNLRNAVLLEWQQKCIFMQHLVCTLGSLRLPNKKWHMT